MSKADSNAVPASGKTQKPNKPYPDFPLYARTTKRWAKKIHGRTVFFGPWDDPDGAPKKYLAKKDALHAGRKPREDTVRLTAKELCNRSLNAKQSLVDSGEFRTRVLATPLTDPEVRAEDRADLYRARWRAELDLRSVKVMLGMDVLWCKTPGLVRKELWAHRLAYNLIRGDGASGGLVGSGAARAERGGHGSGAVRVRGGAGHGTWVRVVRARGTGVSGREPPGPIRTARTQTTTQAVPTTQRAQRPSTKTTRPLRLNLQEVPFESG